MNIQERILYIDIETRTKYSKPDPTVDEPLYIGFYGIQEKQAVVLDVRKDHNEIQKFIDYYEYIAGHNISGYDIPILERYGFNFNYKIILDTYTITDKRAKSMLYIDFAQGERSLRFLCDYFKLTHQKGEYDYSKLQHDLSPEEYIEMEKYLIGDLFSGAELLQYYYSLFYGFREYMSDKNKKRMAWLTTAAGTCAYKCICNMAGLEEVYNDGADNKTNDSSYAGGFVSLPEQDVVEGNIKLYDFKSLYPHVMMMGNLYSPSKLGWSGSGVLPSVYVNYEDGILGTYSRTPGVIEQTIQKLYNKRAALKAKGVSGGAELAIKIIINSSYGISGSPLFSSLYNKTTATDCCSMARRMIKNARTVFTEAGYSCVYTDTDSVYVLDPYDDEKKLSDLAVYITDIQRKSANVPISTHELEKECDIKRMYFFRKDTGEFAKKYYIYVTEDDKIHPKGIRIVRGDCSKFAKHIYTKYIVPKIEKGESIIFPAEVLYNIAKREVESNTDLLLKRYRVKKFGEYKQPATGLHAQISKRYNEGEHYLIINKKIGAGKGNRYAKLEELKEKYKSEWWKQVKIGMYVNDLKCFVIPEERNQIDKLDKKREK